MQFQLWSYLLLAKRMVVAFRQSVNIVLLPMQRRIGLNDDALARGLLELFDQRRLARLERLRNLWIDAEGEAARVHVGGHFSRFGLDFVADCGDRLDPAGSSAVGARLRQYAFQRLFRAFARDAHQAEFVEGE